METPIDQMWTESARGYDGIVHRQLADSAEVAVWTDRLREHLGAAPLDVIDVGCGPGFLSVLLNRLGHRVTSVDGSEGMVTAATANLRAHYADSKVYRGDAVSLAEEADGSLDAIISRDVVWTMYDPAAAYRRWFEVLRPGGQVLVYDGDFRSDQRSLVRSARHLLSRILIRVTEGPQDYNTREDHHFESFDLPAVTQARPELDVQLLRAAGFTDIQTGPDRHRNSPRNMEFWKYGYQGKRFVVSARKEL